MPTRLLFNYRAHAVLHTALLSAVTFSIGCAHAKRVEIFSKTIALPDGRWSGKVEVPVPRRAAHKNHDFEIELTLRARCSPLLTVAFPDGETARLGAKRPVWQGLLASRAEAAVHVSAGSPEPVSDAAPLVNNEDTDRDPASMSQAPGEHARVTGEVSVRSGVAAPPAGRWQERTIGSWPGQLEFRAMREARCSNAGVWRRRYRNAFDENGKITLWAEVPQELADAKLEVRVVELVTPDPKPRRARAKVPIQAKVRLPRVAVQRPRPKKPDAKIEKHGAAKAAGAVWRAGYWYWVDGRGRWVWTSGYWMRPAQVPQARVDVRGRPRIRGSLWVEGSWGWDMRAGAWQWVTGYWTRPKQRVERRPAAPTSGATWLRGGWVVVRGEYQWIAGRYVTAKSGPPAPKTEAKPPSPTSGSVWLAGYWMQRGTGYAWVRGHWERPPGRGYVWVPSPPDTFGRILGGTWVLRIEVSR